MIYRDNFFLKQSNFSLSCCSIRWRHGQFCAVPHGCSELGWKEVFDPGGDPNLQTWHPMPTGSWSLLWHVSARPGKFGLPEQLLPQTMVSMSGCGEQQRPWWLCSVLQSQTLPVTKHNTSSTVRHDVEDQSGGNHRRSTLPSNRSGLLCRGNASKSTERLGGPTQRTGFRSPAQPAERCTENRGRRKSRCQRSSDSMWRF